MLKDCGQLDGEKYDPKKIRILKEGECFIWLDGSVVTDFLTTSFVFINQS